ncbi:MAG: sulfotransferase domain-containing protein [Egibacteraceae bacterium]
MLPTFLGIGVPKAGTTWICDILRTHPEVAMASRKEVHYFDRSFEKGIDWYERFFTSPPGKAARAIGEFTPHYVFDPVVPRRVRSVPSVEQFVLIVRNPVDRAVSHYRFRQQVDNYCGSFEEFLASYPHAREWGRYASHLRPWLDEFDRGQFLVLVYEDAVLDPEGTKHRLAEWLGVDPAAFPAQAARDASNRSFLPRHRRAYAAATRQAQFLRSHDLDWAIELGRRMGVKRVLSRRSRREGATGIDPDIREALWREFESEIDALEVLCGLDLSSWRPRVPRTRAKRL